jgi:hypothetical protein
LAAGAEDFWLIFTLLGVTMSQKSSVPQRRRSVSGVMTPDTVGGHQPRRPVVAGRMTDYILVQRAAASK